MDTFKSSSGSGMDEKTSVTADAITFTPPVFQTKRVITQRQVQMYSIGGVM